MQVLQSFRETGVSEKIACPILLDHHPKKFFSE